MIAVTVRVALDGLEIEVTVESAWEEAATEDRGLAATGVLARAHAAAQAGLDEQAP